MVEYHGDGRPFLSLSLDESKWTKDNVSKHLFSAWNKKSKTKSDLKEFSMYHFSKKDEGDFFANMFIPIDIKFIEKAKSDQKKYIVITCFRYAMDKTKSNRKGSPYRKIEVAMLGVISASSILLHLSNQVSKNSGLVFHGCSLSFECAILINSERLQIKLDELQDEFNILDTSQIVVPIEDKNESFLYVFHVDPPTRPEDTNMLYMALQNSVLFQDWVLGRLRLLCQFYKYYHVFQHESANSSLMKQLEEIIPVTSINDFQRDRMVMWFLITVFGRHQELINWYRDAEQIILSLRLHQLSSEFQRLDTLQRNEIVIKKTDLSILTNFEFSVCDISQRILEKVLHKCFNNESDSKKYMEQSNMTPFLVDLTFRCLGMIEANIGDIKFNYE